MEQQIAVELAVGRQGGVEDQPQDGLGLFDLSEGVGRAADRLQLVAEDLAKRPPRRPSAWLFRRQPAE